jgi:hypothetical protein
MVPGLGEAVARQELVRNASFLNVTENIGGFEVLPLSVFHYTTLHTVRHPLITGRTPGPMDLVGFFWILSPGYSPQGGRPLKAHLKRCRKFLPPAPPWFKTRRAMRRWNVRTLEAMARAAQLIQAARDYVTESFMDRSAPAGGSMPSYYSEAAGICGKLAREYGWTEDYIMRIPIKRVLQYSKEIQSFHNPKAVLFNPSDRVTMEFQKARNAKAPVKPAIVSEPIDAGGGKGQPS